MKYDIKIIQSIIMAGLGAICSSCSDSPKKSPNLVIVFADEMRGQSLGFIGQEPVITPNLDKLAGESLVLANAVSNYPVCSPYRAMFLTGKYPHSNGVTTNVNSLQPGIELSSNDVCWSDVLQE